MILRLKHNSDFKVEREGLVSRASALLKLHKDKTCSLMNENEATNLQHGNRTSVLSNSLH